MMFSLMSSNYSYCLLCPSPFSYFGQKHIIGTLSHILPYSSVLSICVHSFTTTKHIEQGLSNDHILIDVLILLEQVIFQNICIFPLILIYWVFMSNFH